MAILAFEDRSGSLLDLAKAFQGSQKEKSFEHQETTPIAPYELSSREKTVLELFYGVSRGNSGWVVRIVDLTLPTGMRHSEFLDLVHKLCRTGHLSTKSVPDSYGITELGISYLHVMQ